MNTLVVMISGKQGSGKTTTARALAERWNAEGIPSHLYKFAQPIYEMHDKVYEVAADYGIEPPPGGKDKTLLQLLGTEWGRYTRGKNIWVRCAQRQIEKMTESLREAGRFHTIIIDDVRFRNELGMLSHDVVKIRLECPRDIRHRRCPAWRDNETHASETDLDCSLSEFHLVIDTSDPDKDKTVSAVDRVCRAQFPSQHQGF